MLKQKYKIRSLLYFGKLFAMALIVAAVLSAGGKFVLADQFDKKIAELQSQNNAHQKVADRLANQAASYQDAIDKLQSQINAIQESIIANQKASNELSRQIQKKEAELDHEKYVLGINIKTMYLEGQISTLEILAASKNLSEFVDKEQYRNAVADKIKVTLDKIEALKASLQKKQAALKALIKEQQDQRAELAENEAEQSKMLAFTASQKAEFDAKIRNNKSKIAELRRQQAIENAKLFGFGYIKTARCDIYPQKWCNAPMDSIVDNWGMYNRECVSWTAFRVAMSGRHMPYWGGRGNANQWDDNARAAGVPVDGSPRAGDVAISNRGFYGHAMYVENVYSDGTILVSQFNADWQGRYSLAKINVGSLVFIHFR